MIEERFFKCARAYGCLLHRKEEEAAPPPRNLRIPIKDNPDYAIIVRGQFVWKSLTDLCVDYYMPEEQIIAAFQKHPPTMQDVVETLEPYGLGVDCLYLDDLIVISPVIRERVPLCVLEEGYTFDNLSTHPHYKDAYNNEILRRQLCKT